MATNYKNVMQSSRPVNKLLHVNLDCSTLANFKRWHLTLDKTTYRWERLQPLYFTEISAEEEKNHSFVDSSKNISLSKKNSQVDKRYKRNLRVNSDGAKS